MFNSQAAAENYPSDLKESELSEINSSLQKANNEYMDILYNVEDKLHNILNLRAPDVVQPASPPPKSINDFVSSVHEQMQTYNNHNVRFRKVLEHIKRIIG